MYYGNHPDDSNRQQGLGFVDPIVTPIIGAVGVVGSLVSKIFGDKAEEKERKKLEKAVKKAQQLQQNELAAAEQVRAEKEQTQKMWLYTLGAAGAIAIALLVISKATKK